MSPLSLFANWLRFMPSAANNSSHSTRRRMPCLEILEDRTTPAIIYAVTTTDHLVSFNSTTPGTFLSDVAITGVGAGEEIEAIDFSPSSGSLFLISSGASVAHFYSLNPNSGAATARVPFSIPSFGALTGTDFGFDFNPVSNRPRLVTNAEENFVFTVNLPSPTQETNLAYVAGDANAGVNPTVTAIAYNVNFIGATNTTLFGIDAGTDALVRIGSVGGTPDGAGTGKLTTIGTGLGVNTTNQVGFDIADGTASIAFASLTVAGATRSKLHQVNTNTGVATAVGDIGPTSNLFIRDIAVALVGHLQIGPAVVSGSETGGQVALTVTRSVPSLVTTQVQFELLVGTATAGVDFTLPPPITFNPGETSKTVPVTLINDAQIEGAETIVLRLAGVTNGASTDASQIVTVTVQDSPFFVAGAGSAPRIRIFDDSGALLNDLRVYPAAFTGGVRVATGDVNGDGFVDVIVAPGSGTPQRVKVIDGAQLASLPAGAAIPDSALLGNFFAFAPTSSAGVFVAAGDVNGDGKADIIVGQGNSGSTVKVIDGTKLNQVSGQGQIAASALLSVFKAYPGFTGGVTVAAGDVNGDGKDDVITGPATGKQKVRVRNAVNLTQVLGSFFAFQQKFTGGVFVAAGDVNGDGKTDVIAGAGAGASRVRAIDGLKLNQVAANGQISSSALLADLKVFGAKAAGVRVGAVDINGDGKADLLAGSGPGGPSSLRVLDGVSLALLKNLVVFGKAKGVFVGA